MRWSYSGDEQVALFWKGAGQQELYRFRQRLNAVGVVSGRYRHQLAAGVLAIMTIIPGLDMLHIVADVQAATDTGDTTDQPYFEFGASGFPVLTWSGSLLGTPFTAYQGCVVGIELTPVKDGSITLEPSINTGLRQNVLSAASLPRRLFQVQLLDEPVGYGNEQRTLDAHGAVVSRRFLDTVYTTYAPGSPYTGIYSGAANLERPRKSNIAGGSERTFGARDLGYEVPFEYARGASRVTKAILDTDWPRATCVQTVSSDAGPQRFGVYIDAAGVVSAFRLSAVQQFTADFAQNVLPDNVRSVAVAFPDWAFAPAGKASVLSANFASWLATSPDLAWQFNHLGTKACCILHERERATFDEAYLSDFDTHLDPAVSTNKADYLGATGTNDRFWGGFFDPGVTDLYTYGRGVFELGIAITVTGPGAGDFSLTLTPTVVRAPRESGRGSYYVGYAWQDVTAKDLLAGDMLLFDLERWYQPDESIPDPSTAAGNWRLTYLLRFAGGPGVVSFDLRNNWEPGEGTLMDWIQARYPSNRDWFSTDSFQWDDPGIDYVTFPGVFASTVQADAVASLIGARVPFVTGQGRSLFSLRKRRGSVESEVLAVNGDSLLGIDLKTASFAVGIDVETTVDRTVNLGSTPLGEVSDYPGGFTWPASLEMPHRISHPGVAIYTQATLREVLQADGTDSAVRNAISARASEDVRSAVAGWTYLQANDARTWADFPVLRDVQMFSTGLSTDWPARLPNYPTAHPMTTTTVAERNWWLSGMCANSSNSLLLMLTNPNFGWSLYASEVIRATQTFGVTFFAHPNGSWAYYDATRVYNTYGVPDIHQQWTADNAPAIVGTGRVRSVLDPCYPFAAFFVIAYVVSPDYQQPNGNYLCIGAGEVAWIRPYSLRISSSSVLQQRKFAQDGAGPVPVYEDDSVTEDFAPTGGGSGDSGTLLLPAMINIWNDYDTLTPALSQAALFKHQIFDRIHLQLREGAFVKDTTFAAQYNAAIASNGSASDLVAMNAVQQRAVFTLASAGGDAGMKLTAQWPAGHSFTLTDQSFKSKRIAAENGVLQTASPTGTLLKPRLTSVFDGQRIETYPPTFSTCLLLEP